MLIYKLSRLRWIFSKFKKKNTASVVLSRDQISKLLVSSVGEVYKAVMAWEPRASASLLPASARIYLAKV